MASIKENQAFKIIIDLIKEWMNGNVGEIDYQPKKNGLYVDLIQKVDDRVFVFEYKNSSDAPAVAYAIENVKNYAETLAENAIAVVAVPFMGNVGRRLCEEKGVSWLDLSGNADIKAPGLVIHVEGKPNKFKSSGRPKNIFAPKSSRITRRLLINPQKFITQRELASETDLDEGLVSRVVREMEKQELLVRNPEGGVRPKNPDLLLDAWSEKYDFSKHRILKGYVAERTSDLVLSRLSAFFEAGDMDYALTGLSAAWVLSHFATFRTSTIYLRDFPSENSLKALGFTKGERGSNVWLVVPNDEGVFEGISNTQGITCVHPVQVYLDLKAHPERAKEAAEIIRSEYLKWSENAD